MDVRVKIAWFQITQNLINLKWTLVVSIFLYYYTPRNVTIISLCSVCVFFCSVEFGT